MATLWKKEFQDNNLNVKIEDVFLYHIYYFLYESDDLSDLCPNDCMWAK